MPSSRVETLRLPAGDCVHNCSGEQAFEIASFENLHRVRGDKALWEASRRDCSLKFGSIVDVRLPTSTSSSMVDDHIIFTTMIEDVVALEFWVPLPVLNFSLLTCDFGSYVYVLDVPSVSYSICYVSVTMRSGLNENWLISYNMIYFFGSICYNMVNSGKRN